MRPYPFTERDEIRASLCEWRDLVEMRGIADARRLEQLRPPFDPLQHGIEGRAASGAVGLAEHCVVGANLAGEHGIMTARQAAGAGDALGLERRQRGVERLDPGEMRAIGAGAGDDL